MTPTGRIIIFESGRVRIPVVKITPSDKVNLLAIDYSLLEQRIMAAMNVDDSNGAVDNSGNIDNAT